LRIARDLHDSVLQNLSAIRLHIERCKILVTKDSNRAIDGIDKINEIATRSLAEVRSYLSELRMMGPDPSRFRQAIERCASEAATTSGAEIETDFDLPDEALPPAIALAAFHISRELLNNAAAHSKASTIQVKIVARDGNLNLEVKDDGAGFDVSRVRAKKASEGHLGLVGVEERVKQLGGAFTLTSKPKKGAIAKAVIPL
jgi:NarL family two-component system sensor histidine kinase YdfH